MSAVREIGGTRLPMVGAAASYPVVSRGFTLHAVLEGSVRLQLGSRELRLDPDVYAVADRSMPWVTGGTGPNVRAVRILFDAGDVDPARSHPFAEVLRPTDGGVGRWLSDARRAWAVGASFVPDETSKRMLWKDLVDEDECLFELASRVRCKRSDTRKSLFRRLLRARDHIQTHYAQPLDLAQLATVANLSPFHFQRHFSWVFGMSPVVCLRQKRIRVARRLLAGGATQSFAAQASGLPDRTTFYRHLRSGSGRTEAALRD